MKKLLLFCTIAFISLIELEAQSLDNTFSSDGILTIDLGQQEHLTNSIVDPSGNLYVTGTMGNANTGINNIVVIKLNPDGTFDNSFNSTGKLILPSNIGTIAGDIQLDNDGNIYLAGTYFNDFVVVKIKPDGTLDNTFDSDGYVFVNLGNDDEASHLILDGAGNIYVAGNSDSYYALIKLKPDGSFDNTFDSDGKFRGSIGYMSHYAHGLDLDINGNIYLGVSYYSTGFVENTAILKFKPDGSMDNGFDGDGKSIFLNTDIVFLTLDGTGSVFFGGGNGGNALVTKLKTDGTPDVSFDGDGTASASASGSFAPMDGLMDEAGNLFITGWISDANNHRDFSIVKINNNGTADNTFGTNGQYSFSSSSEASCDDFPWGISMGQSGTIFVVGERGPIALANSKDFAIVKIKDVEVTSTLDAQTEKWKIYPIPNNGFFNLDSKSGEIQQIKLTDSKGTTEVYFTSEIQTRLKGTVIVEVKMRDGSFSQKVIIE